MRRISCIVCWAIFLLELCGPVNVGTDAPFYPYSFLGLTEFTMTDPLNYGSPTLIGLTYLGLLFLSCLIIFTVTTIIVEFNKGFEQWDTKIEPE